MTAVAERPAPVVDATTAPARRRRPAYLAVLGVLLAAALVGATALILLSFGGSFTRYVPVTAEVPASSTAVALNSPVEYRNVAVGKVTDSGSVAPDGMIALQIHLQPGQVSHIPSDVRATVSPVSIFGNEYIVLVPPAHPSPVPLRSGAVVPALLTNKTASLQTTLSDLDHLLIALRPGQLDAALSAIAGSLQGQGTSLGQTLDQTHSYLQVMQPLWPTVVADLQTLVPVADQVTASTPDLLGILSNTVAPSQTVSAAGAQIGSLFNGGAVLANQAANLLGTIQQPFAVLAAASGPFLDDIASQPHAIARVLAGLSTWASTWTAAEASGPYLNLTATVNVANPADLGLALLGGPQAAANLAAGLGAGMVNPPTYGAASTASVLAEPSQQASVSQVVEGMTGAPPRSPAVATLLLAPVLRTLVSHR